MLKVEVVPAKIVITSLLGPHHLLTVPEAEALIGSLIVAKEQVQRMNRENENYEKVKDLCAKAGKMYRGSEEIK